MICAMRTMTPEHGVEMAELAGRWLGNGVIGWDLAADESQHPMAKHLPGLRRALELGVPTTVHGGETGSGLRSAANPFPKMYTRRGQYDSLPHLRLAVPEGCQRLGPAVTLCTDPTLMDRVAKMGILVECNLMSHARGLTKS